MQRILISLGLAGLILGAAPGLARPGLASWTSTNCTKVDGIKIQCPTPLRDGQLISIGAACLRFILDDAASYSLPRSRALTVFLPEFTRAPHAISSRGR